MAPYHVLYGCPRCGHEEPVVATFVSHVRRCVGVQPSETNCNHYRVDNEQPTGFLHVCRFCETYQTRCQEKVETHAKRCQLSGRRPGGVRVEAAELTDITSQLSAHATSGRPALASAAVASSANLTTPLVSETTATSATDAVNVDDYVQLGTSDTEEFEEDCEHELLQVTIRDIAIDPDTGNHLLLDVRQRAASLDQGTAYPSAAEEQKAVHQSIANVMADVSEREVVTARVDPVPRPAATPTPSARAEGSQGYSTEAEDELASLSEVDAVYDQQNTDHYGDWGQPSGQRTPVGSETSSSAMRRYAEIREFKPTDFTHRQWMHANGIQPPARGGQRVRDAKRRAVQRVSAERGRRSDNSTPVGGRQTSRRASKSPRRRKSRYDSDDPAGKRNVTMSSDAPEAPQPAKHVREWLATTTNATTPATPTPSSDVARDKNAAAALREKAIVTDPYGCNKDVRVYFPDGTKRPEPCFDTAELDRRNDVKRDIEPAATNKRGDRRANYLEQPPQHRRAKNDKLPLSAEHSAGEERSKQQGGARAKQVGKRTEAVNQHSPIQAPARAKESAPPRARHSPTRSRQRSPRQQSSRDASLQAHVRRINAAVDKHEHRHVAERQRQQEPRVTSRERRGRPRSHSSKRQSRRDSGERSARMRAPPTIPHQRSENDAPEGVWRDARDRSPPVWHAAELRNALSDIAPRNRSTSRCSARDSYQPASRASKPATPRNEVEQPRPPRQRHTRERIVVPRAPRPGVLLLDLTSGGATSEEPSPDHQPCEFEVRGKLWSPVKGEASTYSFWRRPQSGKQVATSANGKVEYTLVVVPMPEDRGFLEASREAPGTRLMMPLYSGENGMPVGTLYLMDALPPGLYCLPGNTMFQVRS